MGLHLGWIPNEPGLRSRAYDRAAPPEPEPDPAKVAALAAAQHARGMWARLLIVTGLFAIVLFCPLAAFAHARWAWGAAAGLALVDEIADAKALQGYHLLPSVRGDLLAKLGRTEEARAEFEKAASLTRNEREKTLLLERARRA